MYSLAGLFGGGKVINQLRRAKKIDERSEPNEAAATPSPPRIASFSSLRRQIPSYLLCASTPVVTMVNPGNTCDKVSP